MWEFRHLRASKAKHYVNSVATKFRSIDIELQRMIVIILIWLLLCFILFALNTESDAIDMEYYDNIDNNNTDRLA